MGRTLASSSSIQSNAHCRRRGWQRLRLGSKAYRRKRLWRSFRVQAESEAGYPVLRRNCPIGPRSNVVHIVFAIVSRERCRMDFIERYLGFSPDHGDGSFDLADSASHDHYRDCVGFFPQTSCAQLDKRYCPQSTAAELLVSRSHQL